MAQRAQYNELGEKLCTNCWTFLSLDCFRLCGEYKVDGTQLRTSHCVICLSEARKLHYLNNTVTTLGTNKQWAENNKESSRARFRRYRMKHPDRCRAASKKWAENNKDKVLASCEKKRLNRLAAKHNTQIEPILYSIIWVRDAGNCYLCQQFVEKGTQQYDHVIPLSRGGSHTYNNIKVTHGKCNNRKGAKTAEEYWEYLGKLK